MVTVTLVACFAGIRLASAGAGPQRPAAVLRVRCQPMGVEQGISCCAHRRWRQCYVDEHYMPTLLAVLGKDDETDCTGHLVSLP